MSILIKGMEMPRFCYECRLYESDIYYCSAADREIDIPDSDRGRCSFCPLIPVPPHGRLIDADKMKESISKQTAFLRIIGGEFAEIAETLEKGFLQEIDNAPTIIPAEEGDNG